MSIARRCAARTAAARGRRGGRAAALSTRAAGLRESVDACVQVVKERDFEQYLAITAAAPRRSRAALFALRAFNLETSGLKDSVSDPNIGSMRVQWWRDALDGVYGGSPPAMPAAAALAAVVRRHALSRELLLRVLDARDDDLYAQQPATMDEVERYAEETSGSLAVLALEALDARGDEAERAARLVGRAAGLVTLLRSTPHHVARRQLYVPEDVAVRHGLDVGALHDSLAAGSPENADNLRAAAHEVASRAHALLEEARALSGSVPREAVPALLGGVACDRYLAELQRRNCDLFSPHLAAPTSASPLGLHVRLLLAGWLGRY